MKEIRVLFFYHKWQNASLQVQSLLYMGRSVTCCLLNVCLANNGERRGGGCRRHPRLGWKRACAPEWECGIGRVGRKFYFYVAAWSYLIYDILEDKHKVDTEQWELDHSSQTWSEAEAKRKLIVDSCSWAGSSAWAPSEDLQAWDTLGSKRPGLLRSPWAKKSKGNKISWVHWLHFSHPESPGRVASCLLKPLFSWHTAASPGVRNCQHRWIRCSLEPLEEQCEHTGARKSKM